MDSNFFYDPANASLVAGLILLGVDIVVIGVSPMMFTALAALVTSGALYATGLRPSLLATAAIIAGLSLLFALLGKKPLERFQASGVTEDQSSDLIGRELVTTQEVTKSQGRVHFSGLEWEARLANDAAIETLAAGVRARVTRVENLTLVLAPV